MLAIAAVGILGVIAAIAAMALARGGGADAPKDQGVAATMRAAGCTIRSVPPLPFAPNHANVPAITTPVQWNTFPPAGGAHFGTPAVWNFWRDPVNPRQVVHNEEHGGVVLWWGPKTPASTIDKLEAFYQESPDAMIGTPLAVSNPGLTYAGMKNPNLGSRVAITAWTIDNPSKYFQRSGNAVNLGVAHVAVCPTFDQKAFTAFRDAYRGHGPEGIPASFNKPGT